MTLLKSTKLISLLLATLIGITTLSLAPTAMAAESHEIATQKEDSGGGTKDKGGKTTSKSGGTTSSDNVCSSDVAQEIKDAAGCTKESEDKLPNAVTIILNSIIGVSSLVAVIFVIIGGVQYMTSSGEATKTKKAKDTILYAVIGLIVCALAFAIVNWVIGAVLS